MARSRNIKPAIMGNEELAELEPLTRLLFIYLWMLADRAGRLEDRPKRIAAQALPYDRQADIGNMLGDLSRAGFICRYTVSGVACIQVVNFTKHQAPHVRESGSELPEYDPSTAKDSTKHNLGSAQTLPRSPEPLLLIPDSGFLIPDSLIPDYSEAKASCAKPQSDLTPTAAITLPLINKKEHEISVDRVAELMAAYPAVDVMQQLRNMRQWCIANASNRKTARGIESFVVRWLCKEQDKGHRQSLPSETNYARSMREKMEVVAPMVAAKKPGEVSANAFFDVPATKPLEISNE